ncbi:uncharacterized protein LOC117815513 [Notolabrus celidotus]|uniref:uncharacterized protein LOC117815513 n=1 Tax=Notolabrus celidotus TaxID=1203425 RepID=UPI00149053C4|nr:uncharacterized protein LOC117815513 [Notolabrus celidotus]
MHSTVMKNLRSNLLPILALATWFIKISGSSSPRPVLTGPGLVYLNSRVTFNCFAQDSPPPVTYELLKDNGVPIATGTDYEGDQPAHFLFKVSAASEGSYHCRGTAGGSTGVSNSIKLSVVTPPSNTRLFSDPSPPVTYEGSSVSLSCNVSKGSHLSYTWFLNRKKITSSASPFFHLTENKLVLENVTPEHAGNYSCMAWSQVHDTSRFSSSSEVLVTVKAHISKPSISFSISKTGNGYQGNVTCSSTRGTPPVNISLLLDDREEGSITATESLTAWFDFEIVPGLDTGVARCRVKTDVQELMSEPVSLEVVPVGGDVRVDVEYLYRGDFQLTAATLSCEVSRGTFPQMSWIFNDSVLLSETVSEGSHNKPKMSHYALESNGRTLVLTRIGPEESGYYRCRAKDSYDDSGPWMESKAVLVQVTEVLLTTMDFITLGFCCFVLLTLVVGLVLIYKVLDQDQGLCPCMCEEKKKSSETLCTLTVYLFLPQLMPAGLQQSKLQLGSVYLSSPMSQSGGLSYSSQEGSQSVLGRPHLYGPSEALLGRFLELNCKLPTYPKNESILFRLYMEGNRQRVLAVHTSLDGEEANFPLMIKSRHEGNLECVAKAQNNSRIEPTVSHTHYLKVVVPVKGAKIVVTSGLQEFFEGGTLDLRCNLTSGNYVSYTWYLNDWPVSMSPQRRAADEKLFISSTSSKDSGSYICVATNTFNSSEIFTSNSSKVMITVKDFASKPNISYSVLKEESRYFAVVTCQSTKGTPPVHFALLNRTELVDDMLAEEAKATFKVPLVFGQHLGWLQCQATTGKRTEYSEWIPLEVEPIGGPVTMHYDSDVGENYAVVGLRLYCKAAKGTHPRYQWFLNKTLLSEQGSFYYVVHNPPEQSILLLSVGRSSAGTYHCEVSDSFDNTTTISSRRRYLDKDVLNRLPLLVVVVVFGSFTFLILLVSVCCWMSVLFRRRTYGEKSLWSSEMHRMKAVYEGDLDVSEYDEDVDLAMAARGGEFDQTSEDSGDEWPHIVKRRRTLEDEALEES